MNHPTPTRPGVADAATWAKRALDARDEEHTALVAADAIDISHNPENLYAAEYHRNLYAAKLAEAAAHSAYAQQCEGAASSAADSAATQLAVDTAPEVSRG